MAENSRGSKFDGSRSEGVRVNLGDPVGQCAQPKCGPSKRNRLEHASLCFAILLGLAVVSLLLSAGTAAAQYPSYNETMMTESGPIEGSVQDAIDEAADLVYEDLYAELSSTAAPEVGCTLILEPGDPIGAGCSCSAYGAKAVCSRNFNTISGKLINITCSDGANTTTCQYAPNKRSCGCTTR